MDHKKCAPDRYETERYFKAGDHTHVFDVASGLYKPKPQVQTRQRPDCKSRGNPQSPFIVVVKRDYLPIVISVVTLLAVFATFGVTYAQWGTTNKTYQEIEKQTKAAYLSATGSLVGGIAASVQASTGERTLKETVDIARNDQRAWVAPMQMVLNEPVEAGLPLKFQVLIENPGKGPALGVEWDFTAQGIPYIAEGGDGQDTRNLGQNKTCSNLQPKGSRGVTLYPGGEIRTWVPWVISKTNDSKLLADVSARKKSLLIDGCFAYITEGRRHTSALRFFLRDVPDSESFAVTKNGQREPAWRFNSTPSGNTAN